MFHINTGHTVHSISALTVARKARSAFPGSLHSNTALSYIHGFVDMGAPLFSEELLQVAGWEWQTQTFISFTGHIKHLKISTCVQQLEITKIADSCINKQWC